MRLVSVPIGANDLCYARASADEEGKAAESLEEKAKVTSAGGCGLHSSDV